MALDGATNKPAAASNQTSRDREASIASTSMAYIEYLGITNNLLKHIQSYSVADSARFRCFQLCNSQELSTQHEVPYCGKGFDKSSSSNGKTMIRRL